MFASVPFRIAPKWNGPRPRAARIFPFRFGWQAEGIERPAPLIRQGIAEFRGFFPIDLLDGKPPRVHPFDVVLAIAKRAEPTWIGRLQDVRILLLQHR